MATDSELKNIVKEKYAEIATATMKTSCCGSSNKKVIAYSMINDDYSKLDGYVADADLNLGCGLPTEFAGIKEGIISHRLNERLWGLFIELLKLIDTVLIEIDEDLLLERIINNDKAYEKLALILNPENKRIAA